MHRFHYNIKLWNFRWIFVFGQIFIVRPELGAATVCDNRFLHIREHWTTTIGADDIMAALINCYKSRAQVLSLKIDRKFLDRKFIQTQYNAISSHSIASRSLSGALKIAAKQRYSYWPLDFLFDRCSFSLRDICISIGQIEQLAHSKFIYFSCLIRRARVHTNLHFGSSSSSNHYSCGFDFVMRIKCSEFSRASALSRLAVLW